MDAHSLAVDPRVTFFPDMNRYGKVKPLRSDVDCWRWRRFENIRVNKGDEIKLVADADPKERVRLDFVEFIPVGKEQSMSVGVNGPLR